MVEIVTLPNIKPTVAGRARPPFTLQFDGTFVKGEYYVQSDEALEALCLALRGLCAVLPKEATNLHGGMSFASMPGVICGTFKCPDVSQLEGLAELLGNLSSPFHIRVAGSDPRPAAEAVPPRPAPLPPTPNSTDLMQARMALARDTGKVSDPGQEVEMLRNWAREASENQATWIRDGNKEQADAWADISFAYARAAEQLEARMAEGGE